MARVSKTICDRCGGEHVDGQKEELFIDRITFAIGRPQHPTMIAHTGRDLCMNCRDTVVASINTALDFDEEKK